MRSPHLSPPLTYPITPPLSPPLTYPITPPLSPPLTYPITPPLTYRQTCPFQGYSNKQLTNLILIIPHLTKKVKNSLIALIQEQNME